MSKLPKSSKLPGPPARAPARTVRSLTRTTSSSTIVTTVATTRVPAPSRTAQPGGAYGRGRAVTAPTPGGERRVPAGLPPPRPGPSVSQARPRPGLGHAPNPVYQRPAIPTSSGYGVPGPSRTTPGPAPKKATTKSSKTEIRGTQRIKTTKVTTTMEPSSPYQELPEGRYTFAQPMEPGAAGPYSSPQQMRTRLERFMPKPLQGFRVEPEETMPDPRRQLRKHPGYREMYSGSLGIRRPVYGPPLEEESYYAPVDTSFMHRTISPGEFDFESPIPSPAAASSTCAAVCPTAPSDIPGKKSPLQEQMHRELLEETARSAGQVVRASGTRSSRVCTPVIMTEEGPLEVDAQIITEKMVERSPEMETISKQIVGIAKEGPGQMRRTEVDTEKIGGSGLPPTPGSPLYEVISVTSSVAIAGGIKEITKTVTYQTTKDKSKDEGVSIAEVSKMVEEEAHEVDEALKLRPLELKRLSPGSYGVRKRAHELLLNPSSVSRIEESVIYPIPNPDQEQEELQPELMASIMHSEEQGLQFGGFPGRLCDLLFPQSKDDVVDVSSAAPAPLQDVVIPMEIPQKIHATAMNEELERAIFAVEQLGTEKPKDSAYFEKIPDQKEAPAVKNVAKKKKKKADREVPDLRTELPPWTVEELKTVIDLVGAEPNSVLIASAADEETLRELEKSAQEPVPGIDYLLHLEPPTHISRVQLRGSVKPPWFPGYIMALPEFPELIKIVKQPTAVINAAWQAVQPKIFAEDSFLIA